MALSYSLRLACVAIVSMGLLQTLFELLLRLCAPMLLGLLRSVSLRGRERSLYLLQIAPPAVAMLFTGLFCIPRYVANETNFAPEGVGWLCLLLASVITLWWVCRLFFGLRIAIRTLIFGRACRLANRAVEACSDGIPIIPITGSTSRVALVGLRHPFIVISQALLEDGRLNPLSLQVVLDHERAHAVQRDNWKLLSLHCLARLNLPVSAGKTWMQLWLNTAECAADQDAVQGSDARAFSLAEALLTLARSRPAFTPPLASTYLLCDATELTSRVEQLIDRSPRRATPLSNRLRAATGFALLAALAFLIALASVLGYLPEQILHLG